MSKLQEMLAEYRRLRHTESRWPATVQSLAMNIAEHLLTIDTSDPDERDASDPKAPSVSQAEAKAALEELEQAANALERYQPLTDSVETAIHKLVNDLHATKAENERLRDQLAPPPAHKYQELED